MLRHFSAVAALLFALLALSGCGTYQLGTEGKLSFQTLYVEPIRDSANLPQATGIFETQIRQALLRDGRIQLVNSADSADAVLRVDLRNFNRRVATARRDDTGLARSFDLNLVAVCTLREHSGKILFDRRSIEATREIFTSNAPSETGPNGQVIFVSQQLQAEYQTMPLLAETLADRIAHAVLDVW